MSNGRGGRAGDHLIVPMAGRRIVRFAPKRVCVDCDTVLSIYNSTAFCSLHEGPHIAPIRRVV